MSISRGTAIMAIAVTLGACGAGSAPAEAVQASEGDTSSVYGSDDENGGAAQREFDEDQAREDAEDDVASDSYSGVGAPYGCTVDCSGHDAGFGYARDRGYEGSVGSSQSFNEGYRAYGEAVEERVEEKRDEFEAGDTEYEQ